MRAQGLSPTAVRASCQRCAGGHLAVQVDDLAATVEALSRSGLAPGPVERPGGPAGAQTSWLTDPDGYRIELVQWPEGHSYGLTAADFR